MASDSSCNDCVWYSVHVGGIFFCLLTQVCICHLLSSPFVMLLTINLKGRNETWNNIYSHLVKYCIYQMHFEFSSSDSELKKFCPPSQIGKLVTKFTVPLLIHYQTWGAKLFIFNVSCLNRTSRCRQRFSRGTDILHKLLHSFCANNWVTLTPFHHWVKLLVLGLTMGLSLDEGKSHKGKL